MLPEAAYAKLQVAMAHFRQMEKTDRDRTQAREAEDAFQVFLQKFPNDPLAPMVPQAKDKLKELKAPVPQPDPKAVAWMTAEKNSPRKHHSLVAKPLALVRTGPREELYAAAKSGAPTMTPESDNDAGMDILAGGNQSRIGGAGSSIVATVAAGGTAEATSSAESVTPPANGNEAKTERQKADAEPARASDPAGA